MKSVIKKILREYNEFEWVGKEIIWPKMVIDFKNDPNFYQWGKASDRQLAMRVLDVLDKLEYNKVINLKNRIKFFNDDSIGFCFLFLETNEFEYRYVSWMSCESDIDSQSDIKEFEIVTATEFLNMME